MEIHQNAVSVTPDEASFIMGLFNGAANRDNVFGTNLKAAAFMWAVEATETPVEEALNSSYSENYLRFAMAMAALDENEPVIKIECNDDDLGNLEAKVSEEKDFLMSELTGLGLTYPILEMQLDSIKADIEEDIARECGTDIPDNLDEAVQTMTSKRQADSLRMAHRILTKLSDRTAE